MSIEVKYYTINEIICRLYKYSGWEFQAAMRYFMQRTEDDGVMAVEQQHKGKGTFHEKSTYIIMIMSICDW